MKHTWTPICIGSACDGCWACWGGMEFCSACGSFEGATTTHCPGAHMDQFTQARVYDSDLDFVNGAWCRNPGSFGGSVQWYYATGTDVAQVRAECERVDALNSMERAKITRGWVTP